MTGAGDGGDPPCWAHLFDEGEPGDSTSQRGRKPLVVDLGSVADGSRGAIWSPPHGGDLDTEGAVEAMVRAFYRAVAQDDLLGPIFNDVAAVDWAAHLPKLTAFWCHVLFGTPGYEGNAILAHTRIHERHRFTDEHFHRWLEIFDETIDEGWAGPYCDKAISFAHHVARSHARRLHAY